jgi:succinoglycan biosynthesis protein ExoO
MLKVAYETEADIVVDNFRYYDPAHETVGPPELDECDGGEIIDVRRFVAQARPFTGEPDWGLLKPVFRKAFLDENRLRYPPHSRHGEDFLLMVDALLSGGRYALVRRAGYIYTDRSSGWSRTRVDYYAMRRHSEALLDHPCVANDPELAHCFQERVVALKRLCAEWNFARCRQQRDGTSLARMVFEDAAFRSVVAGKLMRKLKKVVGHG